MSNRDACQLFSDHNGRFPLLHLKDMSLDGGIVNVGEGEIDFAAILALAETGGVRHLFVEHDNPRQPLESVARSLAHVETLVRQSR